MSKVILVTGRSTYHSYYNNAHDFIYMLGGNAGIGFELVRLLAEKGHTVYLSARNETAGKEAQCV
jgi:NAD(P)-dependent dehydrogenase (short-subunit alcohol dehydrogenase family)